MVYLICERGAHRWYNPTTGAGGGVETNILLACELEVRITSHPTHSSNEMIRTYTVATDNDRIVIGCLDSKIQCRIRHVDVRSPD